MRISTLGVRAKKRNSLSTVLEPVPESIAAASVCDPLLTRTAITHEQVYFPYGFPVRISTNSKHVMDAAEISWWAYRKRFDGPELDVRCFVADSDSAAPTEPPVFRSQKNLLSIVVDNENFG